MRRTTVMLPEALDARLRFEARRRGVSIADVMREAIASYLPEPAEGERFSFIGVGEAGENVSEQVDQEVGRLVTERHQQGTDR